MVEKSKIEVEKTDTKNQHWWLIRIFRAVIWNVPICNEEIHANMIGAPLGALLSMISQGRFLDHVF